MTEDVHDSMFGSHPDEAVLDDQDELVTYVDDDGNLKIENHGQDISAPKQEYLNNDRNIGMKVQNPHNDSLIEGTNIHHVELILTSTTRQRRKRMDQHIMLTWFYMLTIYYALM